jgi:putative ABC transport system permease protein
VFNANARYLVPVGGMVIGNAMTAAAVFLNGLGDEVAQGSAQIEAALALGVTASQAIRPILTRGLRSGMIPLIDSTRPNGAGLLPGHRGRGCCSPALPPSTRSVSRLILLYALLGSVALAALIAVLLAYRNFLTAVHQLHEPSSGPS